MLSPLKPVPGAAQPKPNVRKTLDTSLRKNASPARNTIGHFQKTLSPMLHKAEQDIRLKQDYSSAFELD